ncbi:MAG: TMEM43 family protein [Xanthobacteraceae bacterium]|nr:TMEM43 family protein [Xanthobacteraceae bacterium]
MSDPGDTFSQVTSTSWIARLGRSILGVLIGIVLIIGAIVLLFWDEGRAVTTARSLAEGNHAVVEAGSASIDPSNDGKLVYVSGELDARAPLTDQEFGVPANALRLLRKVEMYEWKEESKTETRNKLGGGEEEVKTYTYHRVWSDRYEDSNRFKQPDGHQNPPMRYHGHVVVAHDASLGAFHPGEQVLRLLPADERFPLAPGLTARLSARVGSPVTVVDGDIYFAADPGNPSVGDLRVSYSIAPNGPASLIGRQTGSDLTAYQTKAGDQLLMAVAGVKSAAEMFKAAEDENRVLTWVLRLVGAAVMFFGFVLILSPLVVVADVVPFVGSILEAGAALVALVLTIALGSAIIALAWLWYRPLLAIGALVIGFAVAFGLHKLAARKAATRKLTPAAAS